MKPVGGAQPYTRGPRQPGPALDAMTRGRSASGWNPKDIERAMTAGTGRGDQPSGDGRPPRPPRAPRPERPPRGRRVGG